MSVKSMDHFAKTEAAELLARQTEYLDALDAAEKLHGRGTIEADDLIPMISLPEADVAKNITYDGGNSGSEDPADDGCIDSKPAAKAALATSATALEGAVAAATPVQPPPEQTGMPAVEGLDNFPTQQISPAAVVVPPEEVMSPLEPPRAQQSEPEPGNVPGPEEVPPHPPVNLPEEQKPPEQ